MAMGSLPAGRAGVKQSWCGPQRVSVAGSKPGERGNASGKQERADPPLATRLGKRSQAAGDRPPPAAPAAQGDWIHDGGRVSPSRASRWVSPSPPRAAGGAPHSITLPHWWTG